MEGIGVDAEHLDRLLVEDVDPSAALGVGHLHANDVPVLALVVNLAARRVLPLAIRGGNHLLVVALLGVGGVVHSLVGLDQDDGGVAEDANRGWLGGGRDERGLKRVEVRALHPPGAVARFARRRQAFTRGDHIGGCTLGIVPRAERGGLLADVRTRGLEHELGPREGGHGDAVVVGDSNAADGDDRRHRVAERFALLDSQRVPQGARDGALGVVEEGEVAPLELAAVGLALDGAEVADGGDDGEDVDGAAPSDLAGEPVNLAQVVRAGHLRGVVVAFRAELDLAPAVEGHLVVVVDGAVLFVRGPEAALGHVVHLANLEDGVVLVDGILPQRSLDRGSFRVAELQGAHGRFAARVAEGTNVALRRELSLDGPRAHVRVERRDGEMFLAAGGGHGGRLLLDGRWGHGVHGLLVLVGE